jgi:3-hydroxyacyl-CoA dehydrogenase
MFSDVSTSPTDVLNLALENVDRIAEKNRPNVTGDRSPARYRPIRSVGIIGAGMMGTAIAAAHVQHGLPVVIHDANAATLAGGHAAMARELRKTHSDSVVDDVGRRARWTTELAEAAACDLVVESIVETLPAKRQLFQQMQPHLAEHTIVASNTSTIPIGRLAESFRDASRFCGLHFFHPVRQRRLVEVVRSPKTTDRTIHAVTGHASDIGRMPIVVEDGPGFVANRLLFPYLSEALELVREGASLERIEQAAAEFGMAIGPLRLIDEIGLDTTLQAGWVLSAAFPERIMASPLLVSMIKAGRLGRKAGAGFFAYDDGNEMPPGQSASPAVAKILAAWIDPAPARTHDRLALRLILPMFLEATRILEERKVGDVRDIDLAVLFGLGFPAAKGGLLWWSDILGAAEIIRQVESLGVKRPQFAITPLLRAMAQSGRRFYKAAS